jgi:hypothetical protein
MNRLCLRRKSKGNYMEVRNKEEQAGENYIIRSFL